MPRVKPATAKPSVQARAPRKTPDYWIQTGSYKSQGKAEELVTLLEGKGLGSRVFSYASNGDTFYRVRVGPYSNKGEADKFLALVKQVQGLESSYISMVPAKKSTVN
jgi:cell division protein FtsN